MIRKRLVKKHIVMDVIDRNREVGDKIIAYIDLDNRKFKSILKAISMIGCRFEVRSLNDYNDNNFMYSGKIRWNEQLVAMYATRDDEFHLWLGGAI